MKRSLNENVKLDVAMLLQVYPDVSIDRLAMKLQAEGADIDDNQDVAETGELEIYDMDAYEVEDALSSMIPDIKDFIIDDMEDDFPPYESVRVKPMRRNRRINEFKDFDEDDTLNDCSGSNCEDEFDECDKYDECGIYTEDEDFDECEKFESRRNVGIHKTRLNERRKGCCPPKRRARKMVSLTEAMRKARRQSGLNESTANRAIRKAVNESLAKKKHMSKLDQIKKELGTVKYNFIIESLKAKKKHLYENKKINGKSMSKYSSKELYTILKKVNEQKKKLEKKLSSLNESLTVKEKAELKKEIELKNRLFNILDEELTYRLTLKNLLKEDDENPLAPLPMGPEVGTDDGEKSDEETTDENPDEFEEVELARVKITVDSKEAAEDLINACVEAGIPEDAMEIESNEDEDEESEETEGEESEESTEGEEEQPNEAYHYNRFKKLLEADEDAEEGDEPAEDEGDDENATDEPAEGEESDEEESEDDGQVVVTLTNTDYVETLGEVLFNTYGIEPDEFTEMIGGEIVSDDEDDSEDSSDEESEDEEKKDDEGSKGDDAVDSLSDDDLKDLFGGE